VLFQYVSSRGLAALEEAEEVVVVVADHEKSAVFSLFQEKFWERKKYNFLIFMNLFLTALVQLVVHSSHGMEIICQCLRIIRPSSASALSCLKNVDRFDFRYQRKSDRITYDSTKPTSAAV